jgi:hypothetical protein
MSKFESFKSIAKEIGGKIATEVATSLVGAKSLLEYDVFPTPFATVGGGLFSIHSATKSRSSSHLHHPDSKVSVWILDKKAILAQDTTTSACDFQQQSNSFSSSSKAAARSSSRRLDQLILMIKYDLHTLSRLKHPGILRLISPLEETRNQLVFITEAIECPLSSILNLEHHTTTITTNNGSSNPHQPPFLTNLEKKCGLSELLSTLQFVHSNGQLVHRSISPDTIFIARDGHWKVAAFRFSRSLLLTGNTNKSGPPSPDIFDYDFTPGSLLQAALRPSLGYTAPELVDRNRRGCRGGDGGGGGGSGSQHHHRDQSCDIFSFALLAYHVTTGHQLISLSSEYSSVDEYGRCIETIGKMKQLDLTNSGGGGGRRGVAQPLVELLTESTTYSNDDDNNNNNIGEMSQLLKAALSPSPANRPRFAQVADCSWFTDDDQLNALKFLQDMLQHDNGSKLSYFKATLPRYSPQWSDRILLLLVLPPVLLELKTTIVPSSSSSTNKQKNTSKSSGRSYAEDQQHREIQSAILPIILNISQKQSNEEFEEHMLPCLKPLIETAQGESMLVLLRNAPLLARVVLGNNSDSGSNRSGAVPLLSMLLKKSLQAEAGVDCHTEGLKQILTLLSSISATSNSSSSSNSSGLLLKELKKTVLPAVHALTLATTTSSVRVTCFQALATMATTTIDSPLIKEESEAVLATAVQVTSIDKSSATVSSVFKTGQALVAAATRGTYPHHHHQQQQQQQQQQLSSSSSWGLLFAAEKVLPALCPLLASPSLNAAQVGKGCDMIRGILGLIEKERKDGQLQRGGGGGGREQILQKQAPASPQQQPPAAPPPSQRFNNSDTTVARPPRGNHNNNVIKPVNGGNNNSGAHTAGTRPTPLVQRQQQNPVSVSLPGPSSVVPPPPQQSNGGILSLDMMRSSPCMSSTSGTGGTMKNNNKPKASSSGGGGMMQVRSNAAAAAAASSNGDPFQELMMMGGSAYDTKKEKGGDGFDSLI